MGVMQTVKLGSTNIRISAIGLGAMPLSLRGRPPEEEALRVIHRALDCGITFIDTADAYCLNEDDKHHNERLLAKALDTYLGNTDSIRIATKGGLLRPHGDWTNNGDPEYLKKTIRESFEALGGKNPLFLWQYHSPDPQFRIEDSMAAVKEAVEEGFVQHVGVSNFSVSQIERARSVLDIVSVQNAYNLWDREPERDGVLQYCEDEKLTFFPWGPLGGSRRVHQLKKIPVLATLATRKKTSPECLILAWLRSKSPCIVPIPGASRITSIENSIRSLDVSLSPDESKMVDILNKL